MSAPFSLKPYQDGVLQALRTYLEASTALGDPEVAFIKATRRPYLATPGLASGTPHICIRVPTGGGKTILAAHSVSVAADSFMRVDTPVVLWLVPSKPIREQTLASLKDRAHPNRQALAQRFGENVRVMGVAEALYAKRADYDGGAVIVVATIQSFRVNDDELRKVFSANGELMDHFSGLDPLVTATLDLGSDGAPIPSLGNVFKMRRPMVIIDEAHNARTDLSFEMLARLAPALVVEFTATPIKADEHKPEKGVYASNVLHMVSASELKAADMIKLPVVLRGRPDPTQTVSDAIAWLDELDTLAGLERGQTREFIRPIMLLQAETKSKDRETLHAEKLKAMLLEDFRVPPETVKLATGDHDELDGIDLFATDCPVRFVITQSKLREGWDCSFAYVLCSVAEQKSARAVEQILGRVLRMPRATRKKHPELNQAYAFATTTSFQHAANMLKEGLVSNGFEKIEAANLIVHDEAYLPDLAPGGVANIYEEALPPDVDFTTLKPVIEIATNGRVTFDLSRGVLRANGALSVYDRQSMLLAVDAAELEGASDPVARIVETLVLKSRGARLREESVSTDAVRFAMPRLGVRKGNQLRLFDRAHFLDMPWRLDACDGAAILNHFVPPRADADEAKLDVSQSGDVTLDYVNGLTAHLDLVMSLRGFTLPSLINWLDRRMPSKSRQDIQQTHSRLYIDKALGALMDRHKLGIDELSRAKWQVLDALQKTISQLRDGRQSEAFQTVLFDQSALELETSADIALVFDASRYAYREPYRGGTVFNKHQSRDVGDLAATGEEYDCAVYLDRHPRVRSWVRNTDRQDTSFWLQTSSDRFYPDFLVLLDDGRYVAIEYKGKDRVTNDDSKEKDLIGKLWADRSGGQCLFLMITDRQFGVFDATL
jgi:type III restriction enzyme